MKIIQEVQNDLLVLEAPFVKEMMDITYSMWKFGWDERNGGNISYLLKEEEVRHYLDTDRVLRTVPLDFPVVELANKFFIVTGSGKYFKNVRSNPAECLGILRVSGDGNSVELLWGLTCDGKPTSELSSHFRSHIVRLGKDLNHRVIMHNHATNIIAMTFTHELDEKSFSKTLWKMCTECIVVFPEGVAILPWMVPGTDEIGMETADKMNDFRLVVWPHHGIFGAGQTIDEAFGLIETAEKAAQIYMLINAHHGGMKQAITDEQLVELAKAFGVVPNKHFI
ncbi:rhamnulose-1-phosphate aldolase [Aquibacillus halophilus]|uniref:Rhamnulose-1-phosphate aldolase n=1 Tax=Aquibacillus halophilus TaxID=930132 RepID=A0A6A8DJ31_9BACI|nr:rhamnulose-1-phosphate aldolase [Aquibacillus halophilus]MRH43761.1 rhamnulose-1-phosphate aldolase [Aquibacillus halophilus]